MIMATVVIGMGTGYASVSYDRILPVLLGEGTFKEEFVLFSVRLPRMAITWMAGMALALSGALLQVVMRNDLADPGITGINAGGARPLPPFFCSFRRRRIPSLYNISCRWSLFAARASRPF